MEQDLAVTPMTVALMPFSDVDEPMGLKEEALREGRRALELCASQETTPRGMRDVNYFFAIICAWTGERDLAIEQLETLAKIPAARIRRLPP